MISAHAGACRKICARAGHASRWSAVDGSPKLLLEVRFHLAFGDGAVIVPVDLLGGSDWIVSHFRANAPSWLQPADAAPLHLSLIPRSSSNLLQNRTSGWSRSQAISTGRTSSNALKTRAAVSVSSPLRSAAATGDDNRRGVSSGAHAVTGGKRLQV